MRRLAGLSGRSGAALLAAVLAVLLAVPAGGLAQETEPVPLLRAHAHNDYEHPDPLFDALEHGFTSVEADIHLVDGELLVGHDPEDLLPGRTLEILYLEPLLERVREHGGSVYDEDVRFILLVDVKTDAEPTYRALHRLLRRYRGMLTVFGSKGVRHGAVTAIVSGNRPRELMQQQRLRFAGYDGRLDDLGSGVSARFMPLISDNWTDHFTWMGEGEMPEAQRRKLRRIVATAHEDGQEFRFWATPDEPGDARRAVWHELLAADVDLINTDHLADLQEFLLAHDPEAGAPVRTEPEPVVERFLATDRGTPWQLEQTVPLQFDAFHPQGMVRVGDAYVLSAVEVLERPEPCDTCGPYDRTPGRGRGWLFKFNAHGRLLAQLRLDKDIIYHPGGVDYDGEDLWVPVAEYRPNSRAIVYRVDPDTMTAEEVFRFDDHIGGIVHDVVADELVGVNWGSRTIYRWNRLGDLRTSAANESHFVDYQDCEYVGGRQMLCGGIAVLPTADGGEYQLGGLALVNLADLTVGHEVPVAEFSAAGNVVTRNPVIVEAAGDGLRLVAVPDDGQAKMLIYTAPAAQ